MSVRFAFRYDLLDAVAACEPLIPIYAAYRDRWPELAHLIDIDFDYEIESGFQTDEEQDEEIDELNREDDERRERLSQTHEGRMWLMLEDMRLRLMIDNCTALYKERSGQAEPVVPVKDAEPIIQIMPAFH